MKHIIIFFIFSIVLLPFSCRYKEIKKNKGITYAIITDKIANAKGGYSLLYKYTIDSVLYEDMSSSTIYHCNFENTFKGKYFHVVYSTINPEKSIMLLTPDDYAEWGYQFPDSLYWVTYCIK